MAAEPETSFPLTKIIAPRQHDGLISRPRLITLLNRILQDSQVIVLAAPAGYGKTTLLAELARQPNRRCVWLRLDEGERDVAQLLRSLSAAVGRAMAPGSDAPLGVGRPGNPLFLSATVRSTHELANWLAQLPEQPLVVLDDVHAIIDSSSAMDAIGTLIQAAPSDARFAIASRQALPNAFAEIAITLGADRIGGDAMGFDMDEIELLMEQSGVPIDDWPRMRDALGICEGWPAAINLALRTRHVDILNGRAHSLDLQDVFDRLASEALCQLPESYVIFVYQIAHLERIFPELCDKCLGMNESYQLLDEISHMNLFLDHLCDGGEFRLHALFRTFLVAQSQPLSMFSPQQHLLAAEWFQERSDKVSEIRHLLAARYLPIVLERLEPTIVELNTSGRWNTIVDLMKELATCLSEPLAPSLALWLANAQLNVGDLCGAIETTSDALEQSCTELEIHRLLVIRSIAYQFVGELQNSINDAETCLAISQKLSHIEKFRTLRRLAALDCTRLSYEETAECLNAAFGMLQAHDAPHYRVMLLADITAFHQIQGDLDLALSTAQEAVQSFDNFHCPPVQALARNNLGTAHHLRGAYTDAYRCFQEALPIALQSQDLRLEAMVWLSRGDLYSDLLQTDLAITSFQRGLALARSIGEASHQAYALGALSTVYIMLGQLDESRRMLAEAESVLMTDLPYDQALFLIKDGALSIEEGNLRRAMERLDHARAILSRGPARIDLARTMLLQAHACFLSAGVASALPLLDELADLVRGVGYNAFLIPAASRMPRLWGAVIANRRVELFEALAQPDLRPRVNPARRGLPSSARFDDPHPQLLSPREREIVIAMCEGLSRDEIADRIGRSRSTLDKAISMIYAATGFTSSYQLVAWAHRCGLYSPAEPPPPQTSPLKYVFQ